MQYRVVKLGRKYYKVDINRLNQMKRLWSFIDDFTGPLLLGVLAIAFFMTFCWWG